jgi:1,2-diacylglycerol 3-beta-galactosyltransferase
VAAGPVQHALDRAAGGREATGARTNGIGPRAGAEVRESREDGGVSTGLSILLLFSDTGGGHRAAAKALDDALRRLDPAIGITWCDPLIGQGGAVVRRLSSLYPKVIQRSRMAWGAIYHASNTAPSFAAIRAAFGPQVRSVLASHLAAANPDVVLSVHPLLNHVTGVLMERGGRPRGLMTVVTDLIDLHRGWAYPGADIIVVPTEQARTAVLRCGIVPDRVRLLGLPVDLRFRPPEPGEPQRLRARLGLDPDRPTVLVAGGGEGSGGLLQQVRALAWTPHEWQVIAICGRNEQLRRRLARLRFATPTQVMGFVDNMPELMRASDLAVTKAGPGAIAEALATGIPIVLTSYLPGQETPNVRFVTRSGIGVYAPRPERLAAAVTELLVRNQEQYEQMKTRASEIARPHAALDIARECLDLATRYRDVGATLQG